MIRIKVACSGQLEWAWIVVFAFALAVSGERAKGQEFEWVRSLGGPTGAWNWVQAVDVDAYGDVYVSGSFQVTMTLGEGEPNETTINAIAYSPFVAKYNDAGALIWAKAVTAGLVIGNGASADAGGNFFVTGAFTNDLAVFGIGTPNETQLVSTGDHDIFLIKYDPNGEFQWAKSAGGPNQSVPPFSGGFDMGWSVATDPSGNVIVTGTFAGFPGDPCIFGAGTPNETYLVRQGAAALFVAKYDVAGNFQWAKSIDGSTNADVPIVSVDGTGNAYVSGIFRGQLTFEAGTANEFTITGAGGNADRFLAKYDASGGLLWAVQAGGPGTDAGVGVAANSSGTCIMTGFFGGTATFGAGTPNETSLSSVGGGDIFVAAYDTNGNLLWARRDGGSDTTVPNPVDSAQTIAVDDDGRSVVGGFFKGSAIFGAESANPVNFTAIDDKDAFIASYDAEGSLLWAKPIHGLGEWDGYPEMPVGITLNEAGNAYVLGRYAGATTFGEGTLNETTLGAPYDLALYFAKYSPPPQAPSMTAHGGRALSVSLASGSVPVALLLKGAAGDPDVSCVSKYVHADGTLSTSPEAHLPADWGTVFVHSTAIVPGKQYTLQADSGTGTTLVLSAPVVASTWTFGDVNNTGIVDVDDILCALDAFSGAFNCPLEAVDLMPDLPNGLIDVDDLLAVLDAFAGIPYAGVPPC